MLISVGSREQFRGTKNLKRTLIVMIMKLKKCGKRKTTAAYSTSLWTVTVLDRRDGQIQSALVHAF